jgi:hypothetical protein
MLYRKQAHIFAPLLKIIPERQRKTYQGVYRQSLIRNYFCAQDKIDVSGTTFTAVFTVVYAIAFLSNLLTSRETAVVEGEIYLLTMLVGDWSGKLAWLFQRTLPRISFWAQGAVYYIYLLYCLVGYRDQRELCFYCKYGM